MYTPQAKTLRVHVTYYSLTPPKGGPFWGTPYYPTYPGEVPTHGDGDFSITILGSALKVHTPNPIPISPPFWGPDTGPTDHPKRVHLGYPFWAPVGPHPCWPEIMLREGQCGLAISGCLAPGLVVTRKRPLLYTIYIPL